MFRGELCDCLRIIQRKRTKSLPDFDLFKKHVSHKEDYYVPDDQHNESRHKSRTLSNCLACINYANGLHRQTPRIQAFTPCLWGHIGGTLQTVCFHNPERISTSTFRPVNLFWRASDKKFSKVLATKGILRTKLPTGQNIALAVVLKDSF